MSNTEHSTPAPNEGWPRKLNWVLIGIGVIAFGLIIADRLVSVFQADDMPEIAAQPNLSEMEPVMVVDSEVDSEIDSGTKADSLTDKLSLASQNPDQSVLDLDDVFGSRVVFVSASEPMFVVTEDDTRYEVGSTITPELIFAGATQQQIILNNNGNLIVIGLPDPAIQ